MIKNDKTLSWINRMMGIVRPRNVEYVTEVETVDYLEDFTSIKDKIFMCCNRANEVKKYQWAPPHMMRERILSLMEDCMEGKTMYILPYRILNQYFVIITDSRKILQDVANNATEYGETVINRITEETVVTKIVQSVCDLDKEEVYIAIFPSEMEVMAVNTEVFVNV